MTLAELLDAAKARHWQHRLLSPEVDLIDALTAYLRATDSIEPSPGCEVPAPSRSDWEAFQRAADWLVVQNIDWLREMAKR